MVNTLVNVPGEVVGQAGVRLTAKTTGPILISGSGDPNGVVSATIGSMFLRTDVASLYQNLDGATAWTQVSGGSGVGAGAFGSWYSTATQSASADDTATAVTLNTVVGESGVTLSGGNTLTFSATGWYNLQYSLQVTSEHPQLEDVDVWLRLNGLDLADSDSSYTVPEKHGTDLGRLIAAVNYVLYITAGSTLRLMWATTNATDVKLAMLGSGGVTGVAPDSPSAIVTVTPVDGGGFRQAFVYTATGLEGSPFTIPLPFARNNTNYVAQVSGGGMAAQRTFDVILGSNTVNDISVVPSGGLTAGDKLVVVVQDLT